MLFLCALAQKIFHDIACSLWYCQHQQNHYILEIILHISVDVIFNKKSQFFLTMTCNQRTKHIFFASEFCPIEVAPLQSKTKRFGVLSKKKKFVAWCILTKRAGQYGEYLIFALHKIEFTQLENKMQQRKEIILPFESWCIKLIIFRHV